MELTPPKSYLDARLRQVDTEAASRAEHDEDLETRTEPPDLEEGATLT